MQATRFIYLQRRGMLAGMSFKDLPTAKPDDFDANDPVHWEQAIEHAFPHAPSRRLARALDMNPRLAQKWASGSEPPSPRARQFVYAQDALVTELGTTGALEKLVQEWHDKGLHVETIAAQLAEMHERITGKAIE